MIWRLLASSWLLLLLFGGGGLAWLAFGALAFVAKRRVWGIFAGVYGLAAIIVQLPEDPAGHILQGTLYLVVLLHGLIINQGWLMLLWGRRENNLTVFGNPRAGNATAAAPARRRQRAPAIPQEAEKLLGAGGTSRSDYLDDSAAVSAPTRRMTRAQRRALENAARDEVSAPARPAVPAPTVDTVLIDVNTANQRTIAKLTGMDRALAKAAITERSKRGGFSSLEDFADTAGLQPHEIVRLRSEAYCSSRPR
ncbi:MAG: helix-hairpin-helix domain-containing protein, partial [Cryobacterium sp.]